MTIDTKKFDIALARNIMTKSELAEGAGISRQRLQSILNSKNVSPVSVGRIAAALGVDVTEIISDNNN